MTSAYRRTVDALMPDARQLAAELGRRPSRNQIMSNLRIGRDKARAVLARLDGQDTEPVPPVQIDEQSGSVRRLHAVPDTRLDRTTDELNPVVDSGSAPQGAVDTDNQLGDASPQATTDTAPVPTVALAGWWARLRAPRSAVPTTAGRPTRTWPLVLLALPAFVAIWSGWVGLGTLTGFGPVHPLPGIAGGFTLNTAITLPIGVETYAAYALRVWLAGHGSTPARRFAKWSAIGALVLGAAGQVAYHLMTARHLTSAPWPITTAVACLPVIVLGFGAALAHLQHTTDRTETA
jgi:hypothetical protein